VRPGSAPTRRIGAVECRVTFAGGEPRRLVKVVRSGRDLHLGAPSVGVWFGWQQRLRTLGIWMCKVIWLRNRCSTASRKNTFSCGPEFPFSRLGRRRRTPEDLSESLRSAAVQLAPIEFWLKERDLRFGRKHAPSFQTVGEYLGGLRRGDRTERSLLRGQGVTLSHWARHSRRAPITCQPLFWGSGVKTADTTLMSHSS